MRSMDPSKTKKAGALHLHLQAFVQCLHQHNPLKVVMEAVEKNTHIVDDYGARNAAVQMEAEVRLEALRVIVQIHPTGLT